MWITTLLYKARQPKTTQHFAIQRRKQDNENTKPKHCAAIEHSTLPYTTVHYNITQPNKNTCSTNLYTPIQYTKLYADKTLLYTKYNSFFPTLMQSLTSSRAPSSTTYRQKKRQRSCIPHSSQHVACIGRPTLPAQAIQSDYKGLATLRTVCYLVHELDNYISHWKS